MRPPLTFYAVGIPKAQPRVKASAFGGFARVYNPAGKHDDWKMIVRAEAQKHWNNVPFDGPICVNLTFYLPRPKSHFRSNGELKPTAPRWCTQKPDRDNADKLILDALTNLGIWADDKQVCDGRIRKFYDSPGRPHGCEIEIKECEQ